MKLPLAVTVLFVSLCLPVFADLGAGFKAYDEGDYPTALNEFLPLAQQGNVAAEYYLGLMYANAQGVPQNYSEAARWFRMAAAKYPQAQFNLGVMYDEGEGVPQDYKEAVRWYRLAAEQGEANAQENLGLMYMRGQGVPQDYSEGAKWFRMAANQGDADAQFNLAVTYENGRGVTQDYVEAHMWFNLAASKSSGEAQTKDADARDALAKRMAPQQIAEAQRRAREWKPK